MPIFARTKLILQDDCFNVSNPELKLDYTGPNPQKVYNKIKDTFHTIFGVKEEERVQETEYSWNREGDKEIFNAKWEIVKDMDKYSYLLFRLKMNGFAQQTKKGKIGKVKIDINGVVRTEYPQDSFWERSIFYELLRVFWHKTFYHDKRLDYQEQCKNIITTFLNELKSFLNLLPERI